ncbi:hypothetical protein FRX31_028718, partial [Thalictrum thalictroides]
FKDNLWGSTLFWCRMWWYDKHQLVSGTFEVYNAGKEGRDYGKDIVLRADWDGLYFQDPHSKYFKMMKKYDWTRGKH